MFGIKDFSIDQASSKLEETLELVKKINQQFKDSVFFLILINLKFLIFQ